MMWTKRNPLSCLSPKNSNAFRLFLCMGYSLIASLVSRWTWKVNWALSTCLCIWLHNLHMLGRKNSKDFLNGSPWQADFWCQFSCSGVVLLEKAAGVLGTWNGDAWIHPSRKVFSPEFRKSIEYSFHNIRHGGWEKRSGTVQNCADTKCKKCK